MDEETKRAEEKNTIMTQLATTFADDHEFLRKVNKMTFGLISDQSRF